MSSVFLNPSTQGFYLRHGYVDNELTFIAFTSAFKNASPSTERATRDKIYKAMYTDADEAERNLQKMHKQEGGSENAWAGIAQTSFVSSLPSLLSSVASDLDASAEGQDLFVFLADTAQKQWRLVGDHDEGQSEATNGSDTILFKALIPIERAKTWRSLANKMASPGADSANGSSGNPSNGILDNSGTINDNDDTTNTNAIEVRTTVAGIASAYPAFVTITIADGQGLVSWLHCVALYTQHEMERLAKLAAMDAVRCRLEGNADESHVNNDDQKTRRENRIDAEVEVLRHTVANFVMPPVAPLVLTAYIKAREARVVHTDVLYSQKFIPRRGNLVPAFMIQSLFAGSETAPLIVIRNEANENVLVLPSPTHSHTARISWATLVSQVRHAWRVQRPYFQYEIRENGSYTTVTITNSEQFTVWKKKLQGVNTSNDGMSHLPFELRVYEHASESDLVAEPLPKPFRLSAMLDLKPPFFLQTGALTCGYHKDGNPGLDERARGTAQAAKENSYRKLHAGLSLQAVNILNRIDAYNAQGGEFVSSWDRVEKDEARSERMAKHSILSSELETRSQVNKSALSSREPPTGVLSEQNEARYLAALSRQKLRELEGGPTAEANENSHPTQQKDTLTDTRHSTKQNPPPSPKKDTSISLKATLESSDLISPYRIQFTNEPHALLTLTSTATTSMGEAFQLGDPFGPKYTVPSLNSARMTKSNVPSDGLTAAQRHLQRLTRKAEL